MSESNLCRLKRSLKINKVNKEQKSSKLNLHLNSTTIKQNFDCKVNQQNRAAVHNLFFSVSEDRS